MKLYRLISRLFILATYEKVLKINLYLAILQKVRLQIMTVETATLRGEALFGERTPNLFPVPSTRPNRPDGVIIPFPQQPPKEPLQIELNGVVMSLVGINLLLMKELRYSSMDHPVSEARLLEILNFDGVTNKQLGKRFYNSLYKLSDYLASSKTGCTIRHSYHEFEPDKPEKAVFIDPIFQSKSDNAVEEKEEASQTPISQPITTGAHDAEVFIDLEVAVENVQKQFITLSDEDIELITSPRNKERNLDIADINILAALIYTYSKHTIQVDDLARKINPHKLTGLAKEIASIPSRVDYYNTVIFKDTGLHVYFPHPLESSTGYYLDGDYVQYSNDSKIEKMIKNRKAIIGRAVRRIEELQEEKPHHDYHVVSIPLDNNTAFNVVVKKDKNSTRPMVFRDVAIDDVVAPTEVRLDEDGNLGKLPTYLIKASRQVKLFSLLFKNNPVPTRILKSQLADDRAPISQRELQLYIDILNNSLHPKITNHLKKQGKTLSNSIADLGLCIEISPKPSDDDNYEESLMLSKLDDNKDKPILHGQYDTTLMSKEAENRKKRRQPSHSNVRI